MITSPLLSNVRHSAMITPVSPRLTRLIHINPSCWRIYRSFEIILEIEQFLRKDFKTNVIYKSIVSKNVQSDMTYVSKILNCIRQLGLWWMSPSKVLANEVERTSTTNGIVSFRSPATWTRKARRGRKIYDQWQGPKKRARVNNLVSWDRVA